MNRFDKGTVASTSGRTRHARWSAALAAVIVAAATMQCSSANSPTAPTAPALTVSAVALNSTSVVAGTSGQATVSLTAPAVAGGVSIALSSNNPAVASVQTLLTVPAGSSSAIVGVAALAAGTATITASLNGGSTQSAMLTVTAMPTPPSSISLSSPTIFGGGFVIGTIFLTATAPAGGVVVLLSAADPITVPASVTVPAGSISATFTVLTRAVNGPTTAEIKASSGGASVSATLSVTRQDAGSASFTVEGATDPETCTLSNGGNTLNCSFDGSASTAPGRIIAWNWFWGLSTTFTHTTPGPVLMSPGVNCSLLPPPPLPTGSSWFTMTVALEVEDDRGNTSAPVTHSGVRLLPQGACGF